MEASKNDRLVKKFAALEDKTWFPHGNFRTSVFCEVKTQIVGKTIVFRQSQPRTLSSVQSVDKVCFHAKTAVARQRAFKSVCCANA